MALIQVMLGGKTEWTENGQPYNNTGELGFMDTDDLTVKKYGHDNENETVEVIEYWEGDTLRRRDVDMILKKGLMLDGIQGDFNKGPDLNGQHSGISYLF